MSELLDELELLKEGAEAIHKRLTALEVRSGAVGRARKLVEAIGLAIRVVRQDPLAYDATERLAMNAFRMSLLRETGVLPVGSEWEDLTDDERASWRTSAAVFMAGGSD